MFALKTRRMRFLWYGGLLLLVALLSFALPKIANAGLFSSDSTPQAASPEPAVPANPYDAEPKPLTILDCAKCHPYQFGGLKQNGGKHRFDCQDCHEVIHAYNPLRNNYAEIMPKCSNCHELPHGEAHSTCLTCHTNPHTPRVVPASGPLDGQCASCHTTQITELKQFPSMHSEQNCQDCHHTKHGNIPNCSECHEPHFASQEFSTCTSCHPVHKPLQISLQGQTDMRTCSGCHGDVYGKWSKTPSKHGQVACTFCHENHGEIPQCNKCHTPPHGEKLLKMFPDCLTCHLDVHDMPSKEKRKP
ncbi:MAG: cytochrome C [Desulfuromonas sp.]|nr:MAG: cytochrome C [Desulfuromonas sp.]